MYAKWLILIGSAYVSALVTYQTRFIGKVSDTVIALRLVLYAVKVVLLIAVGRPHPRITN
jgi:hypothetical protein